MTYLLHHTLSTYLNVVQNLKVFKSKLGTSFPESFININVGV